MGRQVCLTMPHKVPISMTLICIAIDHEGQIDFSICIESITLLLIFYFYLILLLLVVGR